MFDICPQVDPSPAPGTDSARISSTEREFAGHVVNFRFIQLKLNESQAAHSGQERDLDVNASSADAVGLVRLLQRPLLERRLQQRATSMLAPITEPLLLPMMTLMVMVMVMMVVVVVMVVLLALEVICGRQAA
eukprot:762929-Hanusia_phi.AAC.3